MTSGERPAKVYQHHRESQRERILEVAERLLVREGIDRVSFSDIARAARMTRATLYEYFPNKQEIAWAIFQNILQERAAVINTLPEQEATGFQRIERKMLQMVELLEDYSEHLRFIVEFNTLYAREGNPARVRQIVEQSQAGAYSMFEQILRQGITDGSIRSDFDPGLLSAALMNLLNGMNSRFALLGDLIEEEYGQPVKEIYREICRAFLRGIQSTPPPFQEPVS